MARPKSASFTAAPLDFEARRRFSGCGRREGERTGGIAHQREDEDIEEEREGERERGSYADMLNGCACQ